jgi:hypothetical protein
MPKLLLPFTLIALSVLLAACGSPAAVVESRETPVQITVETEPSPASMGHLAVILTITDPNGKPIEGASVDVSADHTDMTGMTMGGSAAEQSAGRYAITADFSMSGNWLLTVYVRKGQIEYKEDIPLVLQ